MKFKKNDSKTAKTTVFNLIILDESGSMGHVRKETLSGCNELINVIKATQQEAGEAVRTLVSIYTFQSGSSVPSRYLVKNADPATVKPLTEKNYRPLGCTPLLDAVGSTLTELEMVSETHADATGTITVMTDGYENSSKVYDWKKVGELISRFKEKGWTVNLIGANIDVKAMAAYMNVDAENAQKFTRTGEGTQSVWRDFATRASRLIREEAMYSIARDDEDEDERKERRKVFSKNFFK